MGHRIWFERTFELGLPAEAFPEIVERVRGTPARLEERVAGADPAVLVRPTPDGGWSAQAHVGHLGDLEPLWDGRLTDLEREVERLRPADLTNRATHEAEHAQADMAVLLRTFRERRGAIVARLEQLDASALARTALHPRLEQPMAAVDLFFFVAEHDDHHLAAIGRLLRASGSAHPQERA